MTESGAGADDRNKINPLDAKVDGNEQGRKVAKTMLDGQMPQIPESPETRDEQEITKPARRVAKTQLEINRPTEEQIVAAAAEAEEEAQKNSPPRVVSKTMLEISRPTLSAIEEAAVASANDKSEAPRVVPKTMLEINRPDLTGVDIPAPSTKSVDEQSKKISKTMMEIALPSNSDTAKQIKKVSKTMLDVSSLDAIGMAKAIEREKAKVPVKVRKTLTRDQDRLSYFDADTALTTITNEPSDTVVTTANQDRSLSVEGESNQDRSASIPTDRTVKTTKKKTRGTERFVAKTMLDHSVLSEQLMKSQEKEKIKAAYIAQERANEPVKDFQEVDSKKLASPCAWSWTESGGKKGKVRACDRCQTQVYDFSGMEMPEAEALIFKQESKKKFALYKRPDGKFMTTDCPLQMARKRNLVLLCVVGAIVMIAAVALMLMMPPPPKQPAPSVVETRNNEASLSNGDNKGSSSPNKGGGPETVAPGEKVHFKAGQAETPVSSFFPTVDGSNSTPHTSTAPAPVTEFSSTATSAPAKTQTTTTTSDPYWDNGK